MLARAGEHFQLRNHLSHSFHEICGGAPDTKGVPPLCISGTHVTETNSLLMTPQTFARKAGVESSAVSLGLNQSLI